MSTLKNCYDCGAKPGRPHKDNCDLERCSVCGEQCSQCDCRGHDKAFARWTGFLPGAIESEKLGISLDEFYRQGFSEIFFVKPKV